MSFNDPTDTTDFHKPPVTDPADGLFDNAFYVELDRWAPSLDPRGAPWRAQTSSHHYAWQHGVVAALHNKMSLDCPYDEFPFVEQERQVTAWLWGLFDYNRLVSLTHNAHDTVAADTAPTGIDRYPDAWRATTQEIVRWLRDQAARHTGDARAQLLAWASFLEVMPEAPTPPTTRNTRTITLPRSLVMKVLSHGSYAVGFAEAIGSMYPAHTDGAARVQDLKTVLDQVTDHWDT
jgi:hypothetical protein